jgi:uncharacterized protein YndB with AHSA1/START domain
MMSTESSTGNDMVREVTLTRDYDAPRELVWAVWTEPKHMARWWGPQHFTNPVCEMDVRAGGKMLIHMMAPNGTVYPMPAVFHEVVKPERLVFTAYGDGADGTRFLESHTVVTFEQRGERTRVVVSAKARGLHPMAPQMLGGMEEGWSQSLDKLGTLLADLK